MSTRTIHDPFLNKTVEISNKLTDRLRGKYANGPTLPTGEPEFGWREFPTPPIQKEAADEIDRLRAIVRVNGLRWGHTHAEIDAILDAPITAPQPAQTPVSREPSSSPAPASAGGRQ